MTHYKYSITQKCYDKIHTFYYHVALKYRHTYSVELMHRNIDEVIDSIYCIERTLLRRKSTIARWAGYYMANTDKWYFAYKIDGDTITVIDACHTQNMHDV